MTTREPHPVVAVVLEKIPILPDYTTWTGWEHTGSGPHNDVISSPVYGPVEPYAASIAAAVLRGLAEHLRDGDPQWGGSYDDDELAALADEIEAHYARTSTEGDPT